MLICTSVAIAPTRWNLVGALGLTGPVWLKADILRLDLYEELDRLVESEIRVRLVFAQSSTKWGAYRVPALWVIFDEVHGRY